MLNYLNAKRPESLLAKYCETLGYMRFRAQAELALKVGKIEAEIASRSKSEFLANMSHELRTPLNAIIGFSELIQHLGVENAAKNVEYAVNISDAGRHLLQIISDILDISKIESGTSEPVFEPENVRSLIESSVQLLKDRIDARNQVLVVELASALPCLNIDGRRIKQIIINLLSNAHKFTPDGGRIVVAAEPTPEGGITLSVTDSGPGMTPQELQIALKPFGQVRADHMRTHGGIGLGLPISAALARQHGGDLEFTSVVGRGTTVTLHLPASPPQLADGVNEGDATTERNPEPHRGDPQHQFDGRLQ